MSGALETRMDMSLDDIIKKTRDTKPAKPAAKPAAKAAAKPAAAGKKGKNKKGKAPTPDGKKMLIDAVSQRSKAQRANKAAKARGMDVDMKPVPVVRPRARGKKAGAGGGVKKVSAKLQKRVEEAKKRLAGKAGSAKKAASPAKGLSASQIKITIAGQPAKAAPKQAMPGAGRGAKGRGAAKGRGRGRGRGAAPPGGGRGGGRGIVKPGQKKAGGVAAKVGRSVALVGGKGGRGRGGGRGGKGGRGKSGGRGTLSSRFS